MSDPTGDHRTPYPSPTAGSVAGKAPPSVVVDVWADVVCPWCYIARVRLRVAIGKWDRPHEVLLRHRAFELDPRMPVGQPVPVAQYLGEKYGGGPAAGEAMSSRVAQVAAADGLHLDFSRAVKANSFDAHRLIALARELGGPGLEDAAVERLFSAHFVEGLQIDDPDTLLRCAAEAGLDERRVAAVLAGDSYADVVRGDEQEAHALGVSAVPFAVGNASVGVSGAQPVSVYLELLRESVRYPSPVVR